MHTNMYAPLGTCTTYSTCDFTGRKPTCTIKVYNTSHRVLHTYNVVSNTVQEVARVGSWYHALPTTLTLLHGLWTQHPTLTLGNPLQSFTHVATGTLHKGGTIHDPHPPKSFPYLIDLGPQFPTFDLEGMWLQDNQVKPQHPQVGCIKVSVLRHTSL